MTAGATAGFGAVLLPSLLLLSAGCSEDANPETSGAPPAVVLEVTATLPDPLPDSLRNGEARFIAVPLLLERRGQAPGLPGGPRAGSGGAGAGPSPALAVADSVVHTQEFPQTARSAQARLAVAPADSYQVEVEIAGVRVDATGASGSGLVYSATAGERGHAEGEQGTISLPLVDRVPRLSAESVPGSGYTLRWEPVESAVGYELEETRGSGVFRVLRTVAPDTTMPFPPTLRGTGETLPGRLDEHWVYRARTILAGGRTSAYSAGAEVEIPGAIPPAAVLDLRAVDSHIEPTSVWLTWTAPGDDGDVGRAAEYDLRYSLRTIDEESFAGAQRFLATSAPREPGSTEVYIVSPLQPDTAYSFALRTADEVPNWSVLSNVIEVRTPPIDTIPPAAVEDLAAEEIGETSVALRWTAPSDDGPTGNAARYDLRFATDPLTERNFGAADPVEDLPSPGPAGSVERFTVAGLEAETTYFFALRSSDAQENASPLSNVLEVSLPDLIPPEAISDLAVRRVTATSIRLTWTATGDDRRSGTAFAYDLRIAAEPITEETFDDGLRVAAPTPAPAGTLESAEVTNLAPGTTYYLAIEAVDEAGNHSALSNVVQATTSPEEPSPR